MRVVQFQRKPLASNFSIERLFEDVRRNLDNEMSIELVINVNASKGICPRLRDIWFAAGRQGDVNHVTGDIHYITYGLDRKRTILTVHDCVSLERLRGWRRAVLWLLWYWLPLHQVRCVTVVSEFTKRELLRYVRYDPARIVVIHNPVSGEFTFSDKDLNLAHPRILQVGTNSNKNLRRVVEALRGIPCRLVVIGPISPGDTDSLAKADIEWENYVALSRAQLVEQYRQADMVMFASTYEGFGLPIVEANAIGRPVITSNICAMPEVAADAACIVDPFDVSSIRAGVERLRTDSGYCRQLVAAGRNNAERFRVARIAAQYAALYRRIAESR